jgi:hypothetical protein
MLARPSRCVHVQHELACVVCPSLRPYTQHLVQVLTDPDLRVRYDHPERYVPTVISSRIVSVR